MNYKIDFTKNFYIKFLTKTIIWNIAAKTYDKSDNVNNVTSGLGANFRNCPETVFHWNRRADENLTIVRLLAKKQLKANRLVHL
jgi:hypothetical protein